MLHVIKRDLMVQNIYCKNIDLISSLKMADEIYIYYEFPALFASFVKIETLKKWRKLLKYLRYQGAMKVLRGLCDMPYSYYYNNNLKKILKFYLPR